MSLRTRLCGAAFLCVVAAIAAMPVGGATAVVTPYKTTSESYYKLDVASGTLSVTVHAVYQNSQQTALASVFFFAMPAGANIAVTEDGAAVATKITSGSDQAQTATMVTATLTNPLKPGQQAELQMTYSMPAHTSNLTTMQPGLVETLYASQGPGSFVFVDVPAAGENYFDPGCLKTADQPTDVRDAGLQRWVCGDVTLIALNTDNPTVLDECARLDDRCRQHSTDDLFSAYAQSITDTSLRGSLDADVQMEQGPKHLTLRYFRQDEAWAQKEFKIAVAAFPKLEQTFGFPYRHDSLVLLQSHHIEFAGAAGISWPDQGEVFIAPDTGFDDEVVVHEMAHQWAGTNLQSSWLWEGLAEYGMRTVAPSLGITPIDRKWQSFGYTDNLTLWYNGSAIFNPNYWYGKAGAFWFAYQDAIGGPDNMKKVLAQTAPSTGHAPFDGKWFMDAGEAVSGGNLDALFLNWVFNPAAAGDLLAARRAAHDQVGALTARATSMGLTGVPTDIQANLDAWTFTAVGGQVTQATAVLDSYAQVQALESSAGLPHSGAVGKSWGSDTVARTKGVVEDQRQTIQALADAATQLANEPPASPALTDLAQARDKYAAGDLGEAKKLAASSVTTAQNEVAAGKMIDLAKARQTSYSSSFLGTIGLLLKDPDGDLAQAQKDYAAGKPESALKLSRSAYNAWDGAKERGLQRLAILAGIMAGLSVATWWFLRRRSVPAGLDAQRAAKAALGGHVLEAPDARRSSWKDWENTP